MSVLDFNARMDAKRAALGEENFLLCECQAQVTEEPAGFYPVVAHDARGEVLSSLVCMACETPIYFNNGRPMAEGETA